MRKRFTGPANPGVDPDTGEWSDDLGHEVNVAGRYLGRVKAGDVLEVPDDLTARGKGAPAPAWSAELWEDVKDSPKSKKGED